MILYRVKKYVLSRNYLRILKNEMSTQEKTYKDAIEALNNLQTNAQYLKNAVLKPKAETNLAEVTKFLNRTGLTLGDIDKLSVIHIGGTNGKGTTSAYCEYILRNHGFKTGFYSSPHLLDVRERIRINGKPISKKEFAFHFWRIYDLLDRQKADAADMPLYFRYLTILAFHIFLHYKVDVAVMEVGIGGEYDCTNVIRKTAIAGITLLDLDHTSLLGQSIESIAWHKSGIMKEGCIAFTTNEQPDPAMKILLERSIEKKNNYYNLINTKTDIPSDVQKTNANLALAISEAYITNVGSKSFSLDIAKRTIEETHWPGRYEVKHWNKIRFFLDGAHTIKSMQVCVNWFARKASLTKKKVLIFNLTGDRLPDTFFKELHQLSFSTVIFTPNVGSEKDVADTADFITSPNNQLHRCNKYKTKWLQLEENIETNINNVLVFPCFLEAVKFLDNGNEYDVLVTGSIHLIGAALSILDPTLCGALDD
ncbi:hypothetical protein NQ315_002489 [Exocentrus adspersus]|uniref:Folylpolyglutamate synthase n=1 Tax=Exocentrus adspersus TaxID=1586481 RepID=A0AAV8VLP6_9CUCU|nr:hypothetical protein NQ315_002489 [Exocentrus adspersus]